ncbi:MAG: Co2+/Mg2+ efflux protein ApaG [Gammaproteobacteria bacterium]|jgi:ApaG protein|nr:Co2+/Mg2+ efflux protein ApaG [Gammaproteobacteria bacterium]MBP6051493.1 Co2+/Mg2+ efflux protein ApaG [Pseudomonadales bacterium]MBK6582656.1 Co2+/Mg2+ efflux protein ApaG [Gammaproteobacteria bacterium]MBK7167930.1 Co2+/Mg2+ efflux protein ApaG [Gammaproteobacteria bacterium]MBK7518788.1 Co2+/Mg2+ efflux protein ApaG [Gammaproteobacteria bacterium]
MNENVEVSVRCEFRPESSKPAAKRYAFAYHVTISNRGPEHAQLISRHWIITDGNQRREEVRGLGVVGEQPRIPPGQAYHYSSGAVLETAVGTMEGSYRMVRDDGREFSVPIPAFRLAVPHAVN